MNSFATVIDLWPSIVAFADDMGAEYPTAAAWKQRNSIPPAVWPKVVAAAAKRGFEGVTFERLASLAASRKARAA